MVTHKGEKLLVERKIERRLFNEVKSKNGMAIKLISSGIVGLPDRLVLMPSGRIAFAEIKSKGEKLRPIQEKRKRELEQLGLKVYVIDNFKMIGEMIDEIQSS